MAYFIKRKISTTHIISDISSECCIQDFNVNPENERGPEGVSGPSQVTVDKSRSNARGENKAPILFSTTER